MDPYTDTLISEREHAERKLIAIETAIAAHRKEQRRKPYPSRAEDLALYRRTEEILGPHRSV